MNEGHPPATTGELIDAKATGSRECVASLSDPRIRKTRESILEAFVTLCGERGLAEVSVADICRRARINRATFYRHFEDKADLLDRGIDSFFAEFGEGFEPPSPEQGMRRENAIGRMERLFSLLGERKEFFRLLLSGIAGRTFFDRLERFLEGYLKERRLDAYAKLNENFSLPRSMIPRAIASVLTGLALWWLDNPGTFSPREMSVFYVDFLQNGLPGRKEL